MTTTASPRKNRATGRKTPRASIAGIHIALIIYTMVALGPLLMIVMNSLKSRRAIFDSPFALPTPETFSLKGYETVFERAAFERYFFNSMVLTVVTVLAVVLFGAMAAHALAEYRFPGNTLMGLYLAVGVMIPIRLGTVSILKLMVNLNLVNTLFALILVYTAMGLPLAVFILSQFFRQVPRDLKDAARIDGAGEYRIFWLAMPLIRPGLAAVAVFTMLPVWNDLWFPLILAPGESTKTVTLGAQVFLGQFVSDWPAVLAALTLAMIPVLILYVIFSRQMLQGIMSGAIK
jgi:raffinose/stachyose/melibiose transport system permease protein